MWTTKVTYISEDRMGMWWELPKQYGKATAIMKEDACINIYNETWPPYLETDISGVGLGAGLLKIRDVMNCP